MCVYTITVRSLSYHSRTLFPEQVGSERVRERNHELFRVEVKSGIIYFDTPKDTRLTT
jgi:hypothetical protein